MTDPASKRVAVVVGVGAGLGAALARRFAQGYSVALVARSADVTRTVAEEIRSAGGVALQLRSDATLPEQVSGAHEELGRVVEAPEVLIYNGGRRHFGTLLDTAPGVLEAIWRGHVCAAF